MAKLDDTELPCLQAEGWTLTHLQGVSFHGVRDLPLEARRVGQPRAQGVGGGRRVHAMHAWRPSGPAP